MSAQPQPSHSPGDRFATAVMAVLAVLAAGASVMISPFFVMATDACGPDNCHFAALNWAYVVTWGGVAVAAVVAVVGVVRAARRGTVMWIWPVVAVALIALTFGVGFLLAVSVSAAGV